MNLHVIPSRSIQTNAYLLSSAESKEPVLIDAPGGIWAKIEAILKAAGVTLTELWITDGTAGTRMPPQTRRTLAWERNSRSLARVRPT